MPGARCRSRSARERPRIRTTAASAPARRLQQREFLPFSTFSNGRGFGTAAASAASEVNRATNCHRGPLARNGLWPCDRDPRANPERAGPRPGPPATDRRRTSLPASSASPGSPTRRLRGPVGHTDRRHRHRARGGVPRQQVSSASRLQPGLGLVSSPASTVCALIRPGAGETPISGRWKSGGSRLGETTSSGRCVRNGGGPCDESSSRRCCSGWRAVAEAGHRHAGEYPEWSHPVRRGSRPCSRRVKGPGSPWAYRRSRFTRFHSAVVPGAVPQSRTFCARERPRIRTALAPAWARALQSDTYACVVPTQPRPRSGVGTGRRSAVGQSDTNGGASCDGSTSQDCCSGWHAAAG